MHALKDQRAFEAVSRSDRPRRPGVSKIARPGARMGDTSVAPIARPHTKKSREYLITFPASKFKMKSLDNDYYLSTFLQ